MNGASKDPAKIKAMFSEIAPRYDLLNRVLSAGRDVYWRRFAVERLPKADNALFLDAATGTGDVALEIARRHPPGTRVIGVDFSESMIESGKRKIANTRYHEQIELRACDVNYLPFADGTFDGAIIAFGIRNLPDYAGGIREMTRVVKENGRVVILEFTPCCFDGSGHAGIFKRPFRLYLTKILPFMGGILSGRRDAYRYLSESIRDFPDPERLKEIMLEACLSNVEYRLLTFATVAVHVGTKIISSECG